MTRLASLAAAPRFALRRLRARPLATVVLTLALAAAGALLGWSSLTVALAQETNVRRHLGDLTLRERSLRVLYYTLAGEADFRAGEVERAVGGFGRASDRTRRVRVWHSIVRNDPLGTRLVVTGRPGADVVLSRGRLPFGCRGTVCEAVALTGDARIGERVRLGRGRLALVVGRGSLRPEVLSGTSQLGRHALLVRSLAPALRPLVREVGSTVVTSASLAPARVHAADLPALTERLRRTIVRLERGDPLVRATAPIATLENLAERGRVARERLLVVAGQAAALIVAFVAFVARARRRETQLSLDQLATFGASRAQAWTARLVEALAPGLAAVALALGGLWVAVLAVARAHGLPHAFVAAALPLETILAIAVGGLAASVLLVTSSASARPLRFGIGALDLAALTALALVVWQTWTTGALGPEEVASRGGGPLLLLVPALALFAGGVLLLRVLPLVLRLGDRLARGAPVALRLAFLTAARRPSDAAAATTFLAVTVGSALFALGYRATLERQAGDQARFVAGAAWRVVERGRAGQDDVTPLTRYARSTSERPTPVIRTDAEVVAASLQGDRLPVQVLAPPAERIPALLGWRTGFSPLSPAEIARRLRPAPIALAGPRLAGGARALRVWARAKTDYRRLVVLHFLLPGARFAHVRLGVASRRWRLLTLRLDPSLRGAELVGVEFVPTFVPASFSYDPRGYVDLGPFEQRRGGGWSRLATLTSWKETASADGSSGVLAAWRFERAPVERGVRFDLNGTFRPLIHPKLGLPSPLPGFETGPIPGLAGPTVAAQAVDGLVTVDLLGKQLPVRIVGRAELFPSVAARPSSFLVLDYDTLFAALNGSQPGAAEPTEAWFFREQPPGFASRLERPPFRLREAVGARPLEARLLGDPLAAGTRQVLGVAGLIAAALAVLGLVLAIRSAVSSERLLLAEYEALGVPPRSLRRSMQVRLAALAALGIVAGLVGSLLAVRLVGAFVAVTGAARRPLPPIVPVFGWSQAGAVVALVVVLGAGAAAVLAAHALREPAGRRLRL